MNITIVCSSLGCGGTERAISYLANFWSEQGWNVIILTLEDTEAKDHFNLHPNIRRIRLKLVRGGRSIFVKAALFPPQMLRLAFELRRTNPSAIVTFLDWVNVLTLSVFWLLPDIPIIASERSDPHANKISYPLRLLRTITYPCAKALILVCQSSLSYFPKSIQNISQIIPNPAKPTSTIASKPPQTTKRKVILGMGRLSPEKNFSKLLLAFCSIAHSFPDWELIIYGEGSERCLLESIIRDSGLFKRIKLPGALKSTADAYNSAEIFVLPSIFEGFSNALIEAMAMGLPVVAYDCPGANCEIIQNGENGLLIPLSSDIKPLADAIARLIQSPNLRKKLGAEASKVTETFSEKRFLTAWTQIIMDSI
jgi:GalNAc-alpha-(1->4)-GalNAc-alpha-(1->3)-diNAcBac-PP-undecaprenol alpha-1,4-N-acetyl-D-galactosaminyltransferase